MIGANKMVTANDQWRDARSVSKNLNILYPVEIIHIHRVRTVKEITAKER